MPQLLLELLSEEIPARMQAQAAADLKRLVVDGLGKAQLSFGRAEAFVSPRRLALVVDGLPAGRAPVQIEKKGPRVGAPNEAIQGFLRSSGLSSLDEAVVKTTEKGDFYFSVTTQPGEPTGKLLPPVLAAAIAALPWPKSMRWGESKFRWVRPLHNILAVLDGKPVDFSIDNVPQAGSALHANNRTFGHRFLAPQWFEVTDFAGYQETLLAARVIVDQGQRRARIAAEAERLAAAEGLTVRPDPGLLDEVTGLVEWPVMMIGSIDAAFMEVPPEVLITAMRAHQKYFALLDGDGRLAPRFIIAANTPGKDGGAAIVGGNERVLRARLSDAKFFWDQDRSQSLESRIGRLSERVFHAKLGSDFQRIERMARLAKSLAPYCGADAGLAERAARLAKADLTTGMVGEFPELQGIMGRYYALHDGEQPAVADAIADHYAPQGPSDRCPREPVSMAVALADKLDTLVGFFAIGEKPTGSGDPYALRRAALGIIRIIIENGLRLPLRPAMELALALHGRNLSADQRTELIDELLEFFADRLKVHLREQGVRHDLIAAVFRTGGEDDLVRLLARVDALRDFLNTDDGANLLTAYRRASNIVRIEENKDGTSYQGETQPTLLAAEEETELYRALGQARTQISEAVNAERFGEAMTVLAGLRAPVDAFFEKVTVNCADGKLRVNRLRLLSQVRSALGGLADFSHIEG